MQLTDGSVVDTSRHQPEPLAGSASELRHNAVSAADSAVEPATLPQIYSGPNTTTGPTSSQTPKNPEKSSTTSVVDEDDDDDTSPRPLSPAVADDDDKLESSTDLHFKKKDFLKSRAQLFQSVLLTASLKSLKQQHSTANPPPTLLRNPSCVLNVGATNIKNFQLFIQAPVLSSVTNLRPADEIAIGQQLPFDHRTESGPVFPDLAKQPELANVASGADDAKVADSQAADDDDDDIYREETTLQQQRLTINALKKLSLLLAPIIRTDDDDAGPLSRQLTTKLLNGSFVPDLKLRLKPYQPAQVDLSSFSSLTRQSRHLTLEPTTSSNLAEKTLLQPVSAITSLGATNLLISPVSSTHNHGLGSGPKEPSSQNNTRIQTTQNGQNGDPNHQEPGSTQERGRALEKQDARLAQQNSNMTPNVPRTGAVPINGFNPTIEHTIGRRTMPNYPVVPPHDMNLRNRKVSIQHDTKPQQGKHPLPDKKLQQIKGFRSPMYVPAVLRRTYDDDNQDVGPVSSNGLDPDSVEQGTYTLMTPLLSQDQDLSANSVRSVDLSYSVESLVLPGQLKNGPFTLNKRQYEHILRAAPTRKHWLKDESVVECGIDRCHKHFNFFERRHHCRKCGGIFCKEHTSHFLYINHLAQFTTGGRGTLSRVCDNCIGEYNEFMRNEFGVCHTPRPKETYIPTEPRHTDYRKEIFKPKEPAPQPLQLPISAVTKQGDMNEQLVGSVPANWSWLSF